MKYILIVSLTIGLQLTDCVLQRHSRQIDDFDYGDDADPNVGFEEEYEPPKPIYKLEDASSLFEKFIKDFNKRYKDTKDKMEHFNNFVNTLKEINAWNSDHKSISTLDINMFSDLSAAETEVFRSKVEPKSAIPTYRGKTVGSFERLVYNNKDFHEIPGSGPPKTNEFEEHKYDLKSFKKSTHFNIDIPESSTKPIYRIEDAPKLFESFVAKYHKIYKDERDRLKHYNTFVRNLKAINDFNSDKEYSHTMLVDIFTDLSPAERALLVDRF